MFLFFFVSFLFVHVQQCKKFTPNSRLYENDQTKKFSKQADLKPNIYSAMIYVILYRILISNIMYVSYRYSILYER